MCAAQVLSALIVLLAGVAGEQQHRLRHQQWASFVFDLAPARNSTGAAVNVSSGGKIADLAGRKDQAKIALAKREEPVGAHQDSEEIEDATHSNNRTCEDAKDEEWNDCYEDGNYTDTKKKQKPKPKPKKKKEEPAKSAAVQSSSAIGVLFLVAALAH
eukprot:gnl/TRDRNA2_/TRDRNA2_58803_c0_seq1.p1 gnl/TRDRNA2_/TRDRNA2_58803_c0~~gnl/TRDRNA2_/TRDRNA2_58803_c0_seq1.p1  ORF type:complete len:158 (-),score=42.80 gnl/TRDRNA2_/TRDRNA2_58803_c0_seq1:153-626(-)